MRTKIQIGVLALMCLALMVSGCKSEKYKDSPIAGHWGCEQYVSCRTDSLGNEQWDTLQYPVGSGIGYEVYFYTDGSGKLLLNESPALIKKFSCSYEYGN